MTDDQNTGGRNKDAQNQNDQKSKDDQNRDDQNRDDQNRDDQNTNNPNYIWMDSYRAALLEPDLGKLKLLLPAAETLMQQRERELNLNPAADRAELRALEDAARNLRVLKRELQRSEEK